ncbi:MAG: HPr(Ser) kinase/phosphatase [Brachymonas sp.]|nr:HPr(Ser) kinase/phosphatase [Brachymonas sp.]
MQPSPITAQTLFQAHHNKFNWQWVAGQNATERQFQEQTIRTAGSGSDLVGHLNYIHPYRIQVLGEREIAYLLANSAPDVLQRRIQRIIDLAPPAIIVADAQQPPTCLLQMADQAQIPLFVTTERAAFVIDTLRAYLSRHFAEHTSMHGVFMDILGLGVLITGDSGMGKSELGLELISRGSGLVADDVVDLHRINQNSIEGSCPELLQNLLEIRGIGLLDIRAIFGEAAVRRHMRLRLIVHLMRLESNHSDYERIPTQPLYQDVLGLPIRKTLIHVMAGRNLAVLVEAAVRNTILELRGINTYDLFTARQRAAMQQGNEA